MNIAVIGAGASGMVAALQAARHGSDVTIFESNPVVGKKLLVTGSGRCNITNDFAYADRYTCADTAWMKTLLTSFGLPELLEMLAEIGIPVRKTDDGWYYPLSDSARSVVDAISSALEIAGVKVNLSSKVTTIQFMQDGFKVTFSQDGVVNKQEFDRVIVSAGGMAYPTLGSRGEIFPELERLGHTILPNRPALAPILADLGNFRSLQGIRLDAGVTLWHHSEQVASTKGNLIFTEWGLNGPAVMDISHHVSIFPNGGLTLSLNFLNYFQKEFDRLLTSKRTSPTPLKVFLEAFFPPKAAALFIKNKRLPENILLGSLNNEQLLELIAQLKDTRFTVKGVRGFEYCQISAGGVPVSEVDPRTLQSKKVKGLYLTGETLDVVGPCGGYNLQYAFSSGALAGIDSASK